MQPFSIFSLGGILLVSIEEEIDAAAIGTMLELVSETVNRRSLYGVIVDLQSLEVMDSYLAGHLQQLARTLKLQHADLVVAGLSVPVVMTLLDFNIRLPDIVFSLDVEQGLLRLQERRLVDLRHKICCLCQCTGDSIYALGRRSSGLSSAQSSRVTVMATSERIFSSFCDRI